MLNPLVRSATMAAACMSPTMFGVMINASYFYETVTFTYEPKLVGEPAAGTCEITVPSGSVDDNALLIKPRIRVLPALIALMAVEIGSPMRFGVRSYSAVALAMARLKKVPGVTSLPARTLQCHVTCGNGGGGHGYLRSKIEPRRGKGSDSRRVGLANDVGHGDPGGGTEDGGPENTFDPVTGTSTQAAESWEMTVQAATVVEDCMVAVPTARPHSRSLLARRPASARRHWARPGDGGRSSSATPLSVTEGCVRLTACSVNVARITAGLPHPRPAGAVTGIVICWLGPLARVTDRRARSVPPGKSCHRCEPIGVLLKSGVGNRVGQVQAGGGRT